MIQKIAGRCSARFTSSSPFSPASSSDGPRTHRPSFDNPRSTVVFVSTRVNYSGTPSCPYGHPRPRRFIAVRSQRKPRKKIPLMHVRNAGQYEVGLRAFSHKNTGTFFLGNRSAHAKSIHRRDEDLHPRSKWSRAEKAGATEAAGTAGTSPALAAARLMAGLSGWRGRGRRWGGCRRRRRRRLAGSFRLGRPATVCLSRSRRLDRGCLLSRSRLLSRSCCCESESSPESEPSAELELSAASRSRRLSRGRLLELRSRLRERCTAQRRSTARRHIGAFMCTSICEIGRRLRPRSTGTTQLWGPSLVSSLVLSAVKPVPPLYNPSYRGARFPRPRN